MNLDNLKEIDTWIRTHVKGCKFVGLSEDLELFVEYEEPNPELELVVEDKLKETFPGLVKKVISVVKPSLKQLEATIDELNKMLAGDNKPKNPLLQIGEF